MSIIKRFKWQALLVTILVIVLLISGIQLQYIHNQQSIVRDKIIIGTSSVQATSTNPDYVTDGVNDNVEIQNALNALPAGGGELQFLAGTYVWQAGVHTVSRAIDNVIITGVGAGTIFTTDGVNPAFTVGVQNGWVFRDFSTTTGATITNYARATLQNVSIGTDFISYLTPSTSTAADFIAPTGRSAYVIAASDATALEKAQADVVCDGTNDEVELQAGITAGAGGKVVLSSGTFVKGNSTGLTIPTNTTVEINGKIQLKANAGNSPFIFACSAVDNIKIIGGIIDGNTSNQTTITGDGMGISFVNVTNSLIDGVSAINIGTTEVGGYGIYLNGSTGNRIVNCYCYGNKRQNICLYNGANNNIVCNNVSSTAGLNNYNFHSVSYITANGNVSIGGVNGVEIDACTNLTFNNGVIRDTTQDGIYVSNTYGASSAIILSGNQIYNTGNNYYGIRVDTATLDSLVSFNQIYSPVYAGIAFRGTRITGIGNKVYGAGTTGIYFEASSSLFESNIVYNTTSGYGGYANRTGVTNTIIRNNSFYNNTYALTLSKGDGFIIEGNKFEGATSYAITLTASTFINYTIRNNIGYIAPGEIRTITGTLAGVTPAGIMLSVDNPFGQAVRVMSVDIEVTTNGAASGSMCVGIGSSATSDYATMFSVLPCDPGTTYPYFYNSIKTATYGVQTNPINWATGSGNRYLNFYAHVANAAYVATYTITVMGN